jgi:hypothetical protein
MTFRPVSMPRRFMGAALGATLGAALPLSTAIWISGSAGLPPPQATAVERSEAPVVAVFTGQFEDGSPVYRLPPLTVSATRSVAAAQATVPRGDPRARAIRGAEARSPS